MALDANLNHPGIKDIGHGYRGSRLCKRGRFFSDSS